jgi:peptidoglycan/LPS O-acetylase OafA/YrhL
MDDVNHAQVIAPARMGYVPALDGIRAIAILLVLAYHAHVSPIHGGFIGVDLFFVVSGFLITALLMEEFEFSGTISYRNFLKRRIRRLLPALITVVVAVAVWTSFFSRRNLEQLQHDIAPAIFYISNWWQIFWNDIPYFSSTEPPLLRHLWSLAVEEQWYIVWPLVFILIRRSKRHILTLSLLLGGLAIFVSVVVAGLYSPGDTARNNFLYLSTPTRSVGLLLGAACALVWSPWKLLKRDNSSVHAGQISDKRLSVLGFTCLGLLMVLSTILYVDRGVYYRGGSLAVALLSTVLVACAVHPNAKSIHGFFRLSWFVAIGRRSYGIYLWHWPIFVFTDARTSSSSLVLALLLTGVASELSFRLIEQPVLRGVIGATWKDLRSGLRSSWLLVRTASVLVGIVLTLVAGVIVFTTEGTTIAKDTTHPDQIFTPSSLPPVTGPRRVVLVGDSQAQSIFLNRPEGIEDSIVLSDGSINGCGIFDRGEVVSPQTNFSMSVSHCAGWEEKWATSAKKANAQIALIVIGAWEVLTLKTPERYYTFNTPEADAHFLSQLQKGINALSKEGIMVALLEVPCMRPRNVEGQGTRALPERRSDNRTKHLSELLRYSARSNPSSTVFVEGPEEWCTSVEIANDIAYRWDGVHVWKKGAKLILETISNSLMSMKLDSVISSSL